MKETAYKILDVLTMGKGIKRSISGFSLKLPVRYFRYFPENYEKDNFDFLGERCPKGGVVIDIGAHIGLFAVRAAQVTGNNGKVYAFEPTPSTMKLLEKTVSINNQGSVIQPRKEAIAEKDGVTYFNISDVEGDNGNSLVEYRYDKNLQKVEVPITSVDNFVNNQKLQRVDFVKIDAEGYEYFVLKGAENTLRKFRPATILALHPNGIKSNGNTLDEIYDFISPLGYRIFLDGKEISRQAFIEKQDLFDVHMLPA